MKEKSLVKSSFFNIIYTLTNLLFPLISSMYLARVLSPVGVGKIAYAQNIVLYFVNFALLGLPTYGMREIAKTRGNKQQTNQLFSELFLLNAITTTIALAACVTLGFAFEWFAQSSAFFGVSLLLLLFNYINIDWYYSGNEEYAYIACRAIIIKVFSLGALLYWVKDGGDALIALLITCIATGGNYFFNIIHLRKRVSFVFCNLQITKHLKSNCLLGVLLILSAIYSQLDVTMLRLISSEQEVGYYVNAHKSASLVSVLCVAITSMLLPRLSLYYQDNRKKFYELLRYGQKVLFFVLIPAGVGFCLLAPQVIVLLYGEAFASAILITRIFSVLIIVKGFGNLLCYQAIIATGNERLQIMPYLIATLLNIVLNFMMIPLWNKEGAAIASVISETIVNVLQFMLIRKMLTIRLDLQAAKQAFIATMAMAAIVVAIQCFVQDDIFCSVLGVVIGGSSYLCVHYLQKNEILLEIIHCLNCNLQPRKR